MGKEQKPAVKQKTTTPKKKKHAARKMAQRMNAQAALKLKNRHRNSKPLKHQMGGAPSAHSPQPAHPKPVHPKPVVAEHSPAPAKHAKPVKPVAAPAAPAIKPAKPAKLVKPVATPAAAASSPPKVSPHVASPNAHAQLAMPKETTPAGAKTGPSVQAVANGVPPAAEASSSISNTAAEAVPNRGQVVPQETKPAAPPPAAAVAPPPPVDRTQQCQPTCLASCAPECTPQCCSQDTAPPPVKKVHTPPEEKKIRWYERPRYEPGPNIPPPIFPTAPDKGCDAGCARTCTPTCAKRGCCKKLVAPAVGCSKQCTPTNCSIGCPQHCCARTCPVLTPCPIFPYKVLTKFSSPP